jgi:hypothetical protein
MKVFGLLTFLVILSVSLAKPLTNVKYVGLKSLGKYSGVNEEGTAYEKTYYASNFMKMTPPAARSYCRSFGSNVDLVAFESRDEFLATRSMFEPIIRDKNILVTVGGFAHANPSGKIDFHWISTGLKTFSGLEVPNDKMCLGIKKELNEPVAFAPVSCNESLRFICQDMDIQYAN